MIAMLVQNTIARPASRNGRPVPRPTAARRHTVEGVIGMGGTGAGVLADMLAMHPDMHDACLALDTDVKTLADLPRQTDCVLLHTDGQFRAILEHRDLYPYLRAPGLPASVAAWEVEEGAGVGLVRLVASILLG